MEPLDPSGLSGKEASVPTIVQFVGGESLTLDDDFDGVNQQLGTMPVSSTAR
jgi:hypothetical protein